MAHFAKIENGVVSKVIVIANDAILDSDGNEDESLGQELIASLGMEGLWLQTSYNSNFRGHMAAKGYAYDEARDAFIPPTPYPSWVLDEDTCLWVAPVPMPEDGDYTWDESAGEWVAVPDATE